MSRVPVVLDTVASNLHNLTSFLNMSSFDKNAENAAPDTLGGVVTPVRY